MALAFNASADNYLTIDDVYVRPGGQANIVIRYHFDSKLICAYQFDLQLPDKIEPATSKEELDAFDNDVPSTFIVGVNEVSQNTYRFATFSYGGNVGNEPITNSEGTLLTISFTADASLAHGTELDASLYDAIFPENNGTQYNLANVNFKIIIDENAGYVDLNETEEVAPEDATGVDARVYRTFTDGEWSTICLPFAMTEEQVKDAFGDGTELGEFADWETVENDEGGIAFINVIFDPVTEIEANYPYIIKTTSAKYPFVVEGVDIEVKGVQAEVRHGSRQRSYMKGTYVANTTVPENNLFLSGNKFWYSTGKTKMKAFRAYFDLYDKLASRESAGAKIFINYDGNPTSIEGISTVENGNNDIYSVSGQYMGKDAKRLQRGVYIKNGKKVVKK